MIIHPESHVHEGVTQEHLDFLIQNFHGRDSFFIETIALPEHLGSLPCDLHGPIVGEEPVLEAEASFACRPGRNIRSRLCNRKVGESRFMTVIGGRPITGAAAGQMVLFTVYGGPLAPRELEDPTHNDDSLREAQVFWRSHALTHPEACK